MNNTNQFSTVIKPPSRMSSLDLKEVWAHRELLFLMVSRNIKVRYKQTWIGASWAIFQPMATMLIFTVFFGVLIKVPSDGVPYAIFVYTALIYWNYFSVAMPAVSNSMLDNESIIKKVYFPRLIIPISMAVTPAIDFFFSFLVLFLVMWYFHFVPSFIGVLLVPMFLIVAFMASMGMGLILAALNVRYRDVKHILVFFMLLLFYVTPIIYSINIVPARFRWLVLSNPMAGIIMTGRTSLLHSGHNNWIAFGASILVSVILLIIGLFAFKKSERDFADLI